jgi:hypothetical protein
MTADLDVDDVAVERACKGDRSIPLNRSEVATAVELCQRRGLSANETGELLGITSRTVVRIRSGETDAPYTRPGVTVDNTREKMTAALQSRVPAVRRAAEKATAALTGLDQVITEWDAKEQALERIAELEAELAAAKAALRGPQAAANPKAAPGAHSQARAWAREQGIAVPPKGLVSADIITAWQQATGAAA